MCRPESVSTILLSSPTAKPNAASSNGFCMHPLLNLPKSPPFLYDEQSECFPANSVNSASP